MILAQVPSKLPCFEGAHKWWKRRSRSRKNRQRRSGRRETSTTATPVSEDDEGERPLVLPRTWHGPEQGRRLIEAVDASVARSTGCRRRCGFGGPPGGRGGLCCG